MKLRYRLTLLARVAAFVAVCASAPTLAASQASKDKNIASQWAIWNKRGEAKAFETALKQLVAWRQSAGDPFEWSVYQPVVGDDLDFYLIQSGDHAGADMDSEHDWAMKHDAGSHYQQLVGPHASPGLMEVMSKALGSMKAATDLFKRFNSAVEKRTYTVYAYRPELSTPKK